MQVARQQTMRRRSKMSGSAARSAIRSGPQGRGRQASLSKPQGPQNATCRRAADQRPEGELPDGGAAGVPPSGEKQGGHASKIEHCSAYHGRPSSAEQKDGIWIRVSSRRRGAVDATRSARAMGDLHSSARWRRGTGSAGVMLSPGPTSPAPAHEVLTQTSEHGWRTPSAPRPAAQAPGDTRQRSDTPRRQARTDATAHCGTGVALTGGRRHQGCRAVLPPQAE